MSAKPSANIPLLLNTVLAGLNALSAKDLAQLGLTAQSARALTVLLHYPQLRCSRLSRMLGLEATALSHLLRALARKHLIIRNRVENDNRAVEVRLSERGRQIAQECQTATRAYERKMLKGVEAQELALFHRILAKMNDNITPPHRRVQNGDVAEQKSTRADVASKTSAADLKFLHHLPQTHSGTSNRKRH